MDMISIAFVLVIVGLSALLLTIVFDLSTFPRSSILKTVSCLVSVCAFTSSAVVLLDLHTKTTSSDAQQQKPALIEPLPGVRLVKFYDEGEWRYAPVPEGFELPALTTGEKK